MKLLFCRNCNDLFPLSKKEKTCSCKQTWGRYLKDGRMAEYSGPCAPIGIDNPSLAMATTIYALKGEKIKIDAFTIPMDCKTMKKIDLNKYENNSLDKL